MPTEALLMVGAGSHAMVVFDAFRAAAPAVRVVVRDDNAALDGKAFADLHILTPTDWMADGCRIFHVAIGHNLAREKCFTIGQACGKIPYTIIHPGGIVSFLAKLGDGVFIAAGAIIGPNATIGNGAIVNHGAVVDHDCVVGAFSHIAPSATLGGRSTVGCGVLVGAGALVLPNRKVGDRAVVGAGAVVTRDVAEGVTVVGIPARTLPMP